MKCHYRVKYFSLGNPSKLKIDLPPVVCSSHNVTDLKWWLWSLFACLLHSFLRFLLFEYCGIHTLSRGINFIVHTSPALSLWFVALVGLQVSWMMLERFWLTATHFQICSDDLWLFVAFFLTFFALPNLQWWWLTQATGKEIWLTSAMWTKSTKLMPLGGAALLTHALR